MPIYRTDKSISRFVACKIADNFTADYAVICGKEGRLDPLPSTTLWCTVLINPVSYVQVSKGVQSQLRKLDFLTCTWLC